MRVVIVGPTFPSKGGVSQHTTVLAHQLADRGDDVTLLSWASQYPKFLYPGEVTIPGEQPEMEPFPRTSSRLRWWQPLGWLRAGHVCRRADLVIIVVVTPVQVPAFLSILAAMRRKRTGRPRVVAVCHNVLPHESRRFDRLLMRRFLGKVDAIMTHTPALAAQAKALTSVPVRSEPIPLHLPDVPTRKPVDAPVRRNVLFFGFVRPYKGVDLLVRALAEVPALNATIAGEFWSAPDELRQLAEEQGVADRVHIRAGYVSAADIPPLFEAADALVLPYRSGTASQNVARANANGVPVVATRVGSFGSDVRNDVDGILCDPDDSSALARALERLYEPGVLTRLRSGIPATDEDASWTAYLQTLDELATPNG